MPLALGQLVLIALIGYLWGSLPPGYWMGKLLRGKDFDIRDYGSKKTGATNVNRVLGPVPALIVLVLDLSKGLLPVLLAVLVPFFHVSGWGPAVAGVAALLGHRFPVFIGFKGGRGVMTGSGALIAISLPISFYLFLIGLAITVLTIALSRYVSLGSILGAVSMLIAGIICGIVGWISLPTMLFFIIAPLLVILFHYDNIGRLLTGKERKLGQKEASAPTGSAPASSGQ